jgi:hypothetical protein
MKIKKNFYLGRLLNKYLNNRKVWLSDGLGYILFNFTGIHTIIFTP